MDTKEFSKEQIDPEASKTEIIESTSAPEPVSWSDQFKAIYKHRRALLAAFGCSTTPILIGYDLTLIGSIIANSEFVEKFGVYDAGTASWTLPANRQLAWTLVQYVSAMAAAIASGYLNDTFGRRICFFITILLAVSGTFVELFSPNWKVWILAKLLMGATMGSMQGNTQTYVSEITPVAVRGFALSLFQFWIILGQLIASCVLQGTSKVANTWSWKGAVVSQFGPALFCVVMYIPFVPESPYFLIAKDRIEDARNAISKLRAGEEDFNVDDEVTVLVETLQHERQAKQSSPSFIECFQKTDLRRTLLACLPVVMQIFMGYPLCGNYLAYFLKLAGVDDAFLVTVISVVCSLVAAFAAFIFIEKVGRRPQLLVGIGGMLPSLLIVGLLGFFGTGEEWNYRALSAFCIIWAVFYYASVGAVGWAIVGEISSSRLRAKTTSIAALSSSLFNMVWSIAIPYMVNQENADLGAKTGLIFFGFGIIFSGAVFFCMPETKGRSYFQLDAMFEARVSARKF
ncbi:uncharacterized protein N7511_010110 [Penicillium nucicola]|uniref:uncharacterized protein n=1 Tax=Penicillium nucicola TaxID=1850975 RepID=UPI002545416E|nr:uncharacterized protein N7511_010110 [Penicillium nucicola]KAJ5748414.1 hypothetical protein N7511_010110 [Penicillium nucicola]